MAVDAARMALPADDQDGHHRRERLRDDGEIDATDPPLDMATLRMKAMMAGTATTAIRVKENDLKGIQKNGSSVIWFQSMKSGMPGVDWILVLATLEASSFRNAAMQ